MELESSTANYSLLTVPIKDLVRPIVLVDKNTTIQAAAAQMTTANSHAALILDQDQLCGIVTDQNFRARVIAKGIDTQQPISSIMTPKPISLPPDAPASEAMLLMADHNIRHIPVVDVSSNTILGVVAGTDLLRSHSHNAVYLIGDIYLAKDVETLKQLSVHIPLALVSMVKSLTAYHVTHAISSISQAIARRLLQLAEQQLGEPPIPYAFISAGSLARFEQTAYTDQDNGLILDDSYSEIEHGEYFKALATFVCDGLAACGYAYCEGDIMATNTRWRQPLTVWKQYFQRWIEIPDPDALLMSTIFFDLRCIAGQQALFDDLYQSILQRSKTNSLFQTYLAANALNNRPPLGFFKGLVLEVQADGMKTIDMKKRGVALVTDIARVYALANGIGATNTRDRLDALRESNHIAHDALANLIDAFEFIGSIRLRHQSRQIQAGQAPNNHVAPEEVSDFEQRQLKNAFEVIAKAQTTMAQNFQASSFR